MIDRPAAPELPPSWEPTGGPADLLDALEPPREIAAPPMTSPPGAADWLPAPAAPAPPPEAGVGRLASIAALLAQARAPYCPANGVVWLAPARLLESADGGAELGGVIAADRAALDSAWRLDLPQTACVVDCQTVAGFAELLADLPAEARRAKSLGVPTPLNTPDHGESASGACEFLASGLVAGLAAHRLAANDPVAGRAAWRASAWWGARAPALARALAEGLAAPHGRPTLLGGVYACATGPDAHERAFAAAPLLAAAAHENAVAWAPEAVGHDRAARRLALFLIALSLAGLAGVLAVALR